jgi:hypothetical protein
MINNKHLCDGNNISVYSKPSSDKTMDQIVKLFEKEERCEVYPGKWREWLM